MSNVTLGAAIIVGPNRLDQLKRLLPQLVALDQVVIVDSSGQGSVRNYCKKFKNVEFHEIKWRATSVNPDGGEYLPNDWGFAYARTQSFKHIKTDYAIWLDTDDNLGVSYRDEERHLTPEGVRKGLLKMVTDHPEVDVFFMDYVYDQDDLGHVRMIHMRERLVKVEADWVWVYPIHEVMIPSRKPNHAVVKDVQIFHHPSDKTGSSYERNKSMLLDWRQQLDRGLGSIHDEQRCTLLLADLHWGMHEYAEAAEGFRFFIDTFDTALSVERWTASCFAAKSYMHCGEALKAKEMARLAIDIEPGLADGYFLLAEAKMYLEEDAQDVLILLETGAGKDQAPPEAVKDPLDYTFTPFLITSEAKFRLGQYDDALKFALKAQEINPNDPRPEKLRLQAAAKVRERDGAKAALALYQYLQDYDENEKAYHLIEQLPYAIQQEPEVREVAAAARERVKHIWEDEEFKKLHCPEGWKPSPFEWFESGYIPGRDTYDYIVRRILPHGDNIKRILFVNCGDGFHALLLAKLGYEVVGVDINEEAIKVAIDRSERLGLSDRTRFIVGHFERMEPSATEDPFDPTRKWFQAFDAVVAEEYLHKCQRPDFAIGSLGDCARDDAPIILTVPDGAFDKGDIPLSRQSGAAMVLRSFTQESFEHLLRTDPEYYCTEAHFLAYTNAYREGQGWQVGEVRRTTYPVGPVVRIVCGGWAQKFSPDNLIIGEGTGGSEIAVIQMAREMRRLGSRVMIYGATVGIWDGVFYRHHDDWSPDQKCNLFIAWRLPQMFGVRPNADTTVLWCHDLYFPTAVPDEWLANIDKIAVLSKSHAKVITAMHPNMDQEKIWITRNGIDPRRYMQEVKKKPFNYFFSSSFERGLKELVEIWPAVRAEIPEAILHVGYGTYTAEEMLKSRGETQRLAALRKFSKQMEETEGVIVHGRLNQFELAQMQMECEAWLYPTQWVDDWKSEVGFAETYCITALEAQAAKCVPITRMNGALPEVIQSGITWEKDWTVADVVEALKIAHDRAQVSHKGKTLKTNREWAMAQSWESLAREWIEELLIKKVQLHVV